MNVFLDTNIIIGGKSRREHIEILAIAKKITNINLLVSPSVRGEQQKRSLDHYYGEYARAMSTGKKNDDELIRVWDEQEALQEDELKEREFWKDARIKRINCTFATLINIGTTTPKLLSTLDLKNEISLFDELIKGYRLSIPDAIHLMCAYSGECHYFLTWDQELINRIKKVPWYNVKVLDPTEFLKSFKV